MSYKKLKGNASRFVDIDNSHQEDQRQVMVEIAQEAHCPFCAENLSKYHKEPILREGKYWLLTKNQWPYDHTKHHLLLIHKEHLESFAKLQPEAGKEFFEMLAWAENEFKMPGGGVGMRFGDSVYSAGTVAHLHAQLLEPDVESPDYEPVRFKIGKSKK
ncbi:MAG: hypothetical protein ACOZAN_05165 [Patescibacteria group bacterium]